MQLDEEWVAKRKKEEEKKINSPKKTFKQFVKQCVKARGKRDHKEA